MKKMKRTLLVLSLVLIHSLTQSSDKVRASATLEERPDVVENASAPLKLSTPLPFAEGETLTYEINFSKFILSGEVGQLKLKVSKVSDPGKPGLIEMQAEAVSKGLFPKLFGIKVKDIFTSQVSSVDFGLQASNKRLEEGKVRVEQKSLVDREARRVKFSHRDLTREKDEPSVRESDSPHWLQDMLSACYFVRTQKLSEGEAISIPITDEGKVYNIEVVAGKREEVKVDAGRFKTIKLDAKIFDGRYIQRSGEMFIWVTDDEKRTPVRARIKTNGATVSIELKRVKQS
ncbi:MAG TPA: DUF3108 domain-containing protein [Blastocatellia bacterium]|jgi:hypothetical protein|nr:DUF3108 domain-containing protein [Blastocatellia bacterium]